MAATTKQLHEKDSASIGSQVPVQCLTEMGAYVCNWDGLLIRLPTNADWPNASPFFNIVSSEPLFLTKISEDPYVSISQARLAAANLDVAVNF